MSDTITLPREVAEKALEALEMVEPYADQFTDYGSTAVEWPLNLLPKKVNEAITALRTALAAEQPKQEPVAWMESPHGVIRANPNYRLNFPSQLLHWQIPLYTAPPDIKNLLYKVKEYIEVSEETIDGEWGVCRSVEELIADGEMPDLWHEVRAAINELEDKT